MTREKRGFEKTQKYLLELETSHIACCSMCTRRGFLVRLIFMGVSEKQMKWRQIACPHNSILYVGYFLSSNEVKTMCMRARPEREARRGGHLKKAHRPNRPSVDCPLSFVLFQWGLPTPTHHAGTRSKSQWQGKTITMNDWHSGACCKKCYEIS